VTIEIRACVAAIRLSPVVEEWLGSSLLGRTPASSRRVAAQTGLIHRSCRNSVLDGRYGSGSRGWCSWGCLAGDTARTPVRGS
jgi:hypothetical protein